MRASVAPLKVHSRLETAVRANEVRNRSLDIENHQPDDGEEED
jgi:hypothetical protein